MIQELLLIALVVVLILIWILFRRLAARHGKNKLLFPYLGVVIFMSGSLLGQLIGYFLRGNKFMLLIAGFLPLVIAILFTWGFRKMLKDRWTKNQVR